METISTVYTVSAPVDPGVFRRERTDGDREVDRHVSAVRPSVSQSGRQEDIRFSDRRDDFRPYGPNGVSGQKRDAKGGAEIGAVDTKPSGESFASSGFTGNSPDVSNNASNLQQDPRVQAEITRLKATEERVKAHEAAHKAVGGTMTGPVSYSYTRGPDGKNYITGGEVPITLSTGKTPEETIARMDQVMRAALAPTDPSPQDRSVAAQASSMQQQARMEVSRKGVQTEEENGAVTGGENGVPARQAESISAIVKSKSDRVDDEASSISASGERTEKGPIGIPSKNIDSAIVSASRTAYANSAATGAGNETRLRDILAGAGEVQPQPESANLTLIPSSVSISPLQQVTGMPISIYA